MTALCVFCSSPETALKFNTSASNGVVYGIRKCASCDAVFISPPPTPAQLAEAYSEKYYGFGEHKFFPALETFLNYVRKFQAQKISKLRPPPATVLDVGCGNGVFLGNLIRLGYQCTGIELPGKAAERAARIAELKLFTSPLSNELLAGEQYDVIVMCHVLEHLSQPREALNICATHLKKGGYLVIDQPNIESLQSRLFRQNWFHLDPPRHLNFLPNHTLASHLSEQGLELVKKRSFSLEHNSYGIFQSFLNLFTPKRDRIYAILQGEPSSYREKLAALCLLAVGMPVCILLAVTEAAVGRGGTVELIFKHTGKAPL